MAGSVGECSFPELTFCTDSYSVSVPPPPPPPRVTAVARKRPWSCGNLFGNELACNLAGNILPQMPQLAEPVWTDPGVKSGISVRELISNLKNKVQAGN